MKVTKYLASPIDSAPSRLPSSECTKSSGWAARPVDRARGITAKVALPYTQEKHFTSSHLDFSFSAASSSDSDRCTPLTMLLRIIDEIPRKCTCAKRYATSPVSLYLPTLFLGLCPKISAVNQFTGRGGWCFAFHNASCTFERNFEATCGHFAHR